MKAIQTRYAGLRFRSRLEARWAVFFDALGVAWEYEPQGFDLGHGVLYLPDFRVIYPGQDRPWWFEVKPLLSLIKSDDWLKLVLFARQQDIVLLDGVPAMRPYTPVGYLFPLTKDETDRTWAPIPSPKSIKTAMHRDREGYALWTGRQYPRIEEFPFYDDDEAVAHLKAAVERACTFKFGGHA